MRYILLILAVAIGITDDGARKGRKGNEMYRNEKHIEAARFFSEGLQDVTKPELGPVHSGLWNNLGASLYKLGNYEEATQAFSNAVSFASSEQEIARSAYNAGNNAFKASGQAGHSPSGNAQPGQQGGADTRAKSMEAALEHYRQSMLADPTNEDAKYNYEFVKRQLEEEQQNQQQQQQENQDQQNQDDQQEQNQDQEQQQQQQQNQDQQQQSQQEQQSQQQEQTPQDLDKLSQEEAERILQALQNEEEELLRQVLKPQTRPRKVDKDW